MRIQSFLDQLPVYHFLSQSSTHALIKLHLKISVKNGRRLNLQEYLKAELLIKKRFILKFLTLHFKYNFCMQIAV